MTQTIKKTETYTEQKNRHQKEINEFTDIFFAFNNEQFAQGMQKLGLNEKNDLNKIVSIGMSGFILKDKVKVFTDIFKRHAEERKQRTKEERFLFDSLVYELGNHEYCITYDLEPTLDALGLAKNDIPQTTLKRAIKEYLERCDL